MKSGSGFDATRYAPVAERITSFYSSFPSGRIVTELVSRSEREVVFRASVYRAASDSGPAATGWASEREGDGDVNEVACLENTETSAVGRALANLGFTASRHRPSAEEMAKAARMRGRLVRRTLAVHEPAASPVQSLYLSDLLTLISAAERAGLRRARASAWRAALTSEPLDDASLLRLERRLRGWIARHTVRLS
ncbi:MAG: hypothetical protein ACJ8AD_07870, partial [Gemmatimonadaceae bacterium]